MCTKIYIYWKILKSLRDFRPLRYSSRDGHAGGSMSSEEETLQVSVLPYRCSICSLLVTYRAPDKRFSHTLDSLGRWPPLACSFRSAQAATLLEFHVPLSNCFVRRWFCMVRLRCTITIDSVLTNSKTQNGFLLPSHAMVRHDCP
jgi:hypothetical protein